MDLTGSKAFTRRAFLNRGLTLASATVTIPAFLQSSASVFAQQHAAPGGGGTVDRILVVVQLSGGNDGLNTVVPFGDPAYYAARPSIGIAERDVLKLAKNGKGDGLGLHPRLTGLKELYDDGRLTVVQGVGYPNPNRSHFKSMDIWHTGDTTGTGDGWLGRYFDNQCSGAPRGASTRGAGGCSGHDGVALGRTAPLAMQGRGFRPIAFESADLFRWTGEDAGDAEARAYEVMTGGGLRPGADPDSAEGFLLRTTLDAQVASEKIREAVRRTPLVEYPRTGLGRELAMVASMIRAGLLTRVYYVSHGGFDTHAGQGGPQGSHANLLDQFAAAVRAFYRDLDASGDSQRVLTVSFSEFGRRVGQNGSGGTDHGTAAPMFLMGPMVRPGVIGNHPSLTDLDQGDLKFSVDFRSVYAGVLEDWMRTDAAAVLGRKFPAAKVVRGA
ncbi:MAG: DUF1501 domain-containing protein [Planctomycetota bacterium]|nr:DUF1501 domain-containing protein [Planctomycetota bacterium]